MSKQAFRWNDSEQKRERFPTMQLVTFDGNECDIRFGTRLITISIFCMCALLRLIAFKLWLSLPLYSTCLFVASFSTTCRPTPLCPWQKVTMRSQSKTILSVLSPPKEEHNYPQQTTLAEGLMEASIYIYINGFHLYACIDPNHGASFSLLRRLRAGL